MEIFLIFATMLIAGIVRGAGVCSMVCAPGILSYIASKKVNWKEGLRYGFIFSIPRIVVLTILGGVIGFLSFTVVSTEFFRNASASLNLVSYLFIGGIFFILGINVFRNIDKKCGCETKQHFQKTGAASQFLILGSVVSVGCVAGAFEGMVLSSAFSILGNNSIMASVLGAFAMFLFAFGLSIPIIAGSALAGRISERVKSFRELRIVGATIMVMSGLLLLTATLMRLII
ncbi:MAG: hypothetical protein QMC80_04115 [Thermoplasmatales archaeon]|nr:hypothetical protein [Thermoplasmatales archaeon]